jgi:hypothetical protein
MISSHHSTDQGQSNATVADLVALARSNLAALQRTLRELSTPELECLARRITATQRRAHGRLRAAGWPYGITELSGPGLASMAHYAAVVATYAEFEAQHRRELAAEAAAEADFAGLLAEAVRA